MSEFAPDPAPDSGWAGLRRMTAARVALGRAGNGLPTAAHLDFQEAHARARDAVHSALDLDALAASLVKPARNTPQRPSSAAQGPSRAETAPIARQTAGASPAAGLAVQGDDLPHHGDRERAVGQQGEPQRSREQAITA